MRKTITLLFAVILLLVTATGCKDNTEISTSAEDPKVSPETSSENQGDSENPLIPTDTENWTDEDWENWMEEGYHEEEWNDAVFFEEGQQADVPTDDIWDEEDWNATWEDESLDIPIGRISPVAAPVIAPVAAPVNASPGGSLSVLLTTTSASSSTSQVEGIFKAFHPQATILTVRLQNDGVYAIFAIEDRTKYKMLVDAETLEVYLDKAISIGVSQRENPPSVEAPKASKNSGEPLTEEDARNTFLGYYPQANILKVQLQDGGKSYYIFGQEGGSRYKMKILTHNGEIVLNRSNLSKGGNIVNNPVDSPEGTTPQLPTGGQVDAAGAQGIFASYYPGVAISKIELQDGGSAYYMYGESDGIHYKMKVLVQDGSVVYTNAGGNGYYGNGNSGNNGQTDATAGATVDGSSGATNQGRYNQRNNYSGGRR